MNVFIIEKKTMSKNNFSTGKHRTARNLKLNYKTLTMCFIKIKKNI